MVAVNELVDKQGHRAFQSTVKEATMRETMTEEPFLVRSITFRARGVLEKLLYRVLNVLLESGFTIAVE
jgi:hypothetical protein